jgi:hypothetical protein
MPNPIVLTLPAADTALRDELMQKLAPHADVQEAPPTFGLNEIKLVIELINAGGGIIANATAIATFILLLKDRRKQNQLQGRIEIARLGEPGVPLESTDEATVRRIIGLDEIRKEKQ